MRRESDTPIHRPRVIVADDHPLILEELAGLLAEVFDVVAVVRDGVQLVAESKRLRPDVIVTDLSMPGLDGFQALRQLKDAGVESRVIFLTMHTDADTAAEALRVGAGGFVLKHSAGEQLVPAIQEVLQGRVYVSPSLLQGREDLRVQPVVDRESP